VLKFDTDAGHFTRSNTLPGCMLLTCLDPLDLRFGIVVRRAFEGLRERLLYYVAQC
jgi:hypothetical protein